MRTFAIFVMAVILLGFAGKVKAQSQAGIDLKEIIDSKLQKNERKSTFIETSKATSLVKPKIENKTRTMFAIIFVMLETALLVMLVRKWKERKPKATLLSPEEIKANIEKIRLEKIIRKNNEEIETLRKNIGLGKIGLNIKSENLSKMAKELSISKGELLLAAKLKLIASR